jgi:adenylate cyclase
LSLNFLLLGYPDRALKRVHEALIFAQQLSHPHSQAIALGWTAFLHQYRSEAQAARQRAEAVIRLSTERNFPFWLAWGTIMRGGTLAEQGQEEEGIAQMRQGLAAWQATGTEELRPYWLALLADACGKVRKVAEGLAVLAEALDIVHIIGERFYEAELYRLKGELTLQQFTVQGSKFKVENPQSTFCNLQLEAEECFLKAIEIAQKQQAKSLELRASTSLARLWQQQDKRTEAHKMLSEIYNWFTEGFDTGDLQEARALLESLESQNV